MRIRTGLVSAAAVLAMLLVPLPAQGVVAGITGTVTGPGGIPLSGVPVTAYSVISEDPGDQALLATTTTDLAGEYLLPVTGAEVVVCFESPDYAQECWDDAYRSPDDLEGRYGDTLTVPGDGVAGIDAALIPGSSISGTITTESGAVGGVQVSAFLAAKTRFYFAETDASGAFTLDHLEPGEYVVCASSPALIKQCTGDVGGPASYDVGEDDAVSGADIDVVSRPLNLRILWTASDRVVWTWDPVPGATSYRVATDLRATMSSPSFRWVTGTKVTLTSRNFFGLAPAFVGVRALDGTSTTAPSEVKAARRGAVGGVRLVETTGTSMTWAWRPYVGAKKYQIQISSVPSFAGYRTRKVTTLATTIGNLTAGKTYYVRVRPLKLGGTPIAWWSDVVDGVIVAP